MNEGEPGELVAGVLIDPALIDRIVSRSRTEGPEGALGVPRATAKQALAQVIGNGVVGVEPGSSWRSFMSEPERLPRWAVTTAKGVWADREI